MGVRVDVFDEVDEKEEKGGKKKKVAHQKCRIKITGRKENAEEAKKRILAQVERLVSYPSFPSVVIIYSNYRPTRLPRFSKFLLNTILH